MNWAAFPGGNIVSEGLDDLAAGRVTAAAALVSIGAPRLARLGIAVPPPLPTPESQLYRLLAAAAEDTAHARFNALVRRLVSFERARVRSVSDRARIECVMEAFARAGAREMTIYLVGGTTAVLLGWRDSTAAVDFVVQPEDDALLRALPALKDRLEVNLELASPLDFIPVPEGWEERSPLIRRIGDVSFRHFDPYAQVLAKLERGHAQDLTDAREMLARGLVDGKRLREYFATIEPRLYRFPAIDAPSFRRAVDAFLQA